MLLPKCVLDKVTMLFPSKHNHFLFLTVMSWHLQQSPWSRGWRSALQNRRCYERIQRNNIPKTTLKTWTKPTELNFSFSKLCLWIFLLLSIMKFSRAMIIYQGSTQDISTFPAWGIQEQSSLLWICCCLQASKRLLCFYRQQTVSHDEENVLY